MLVEFYRSDAPDVVVATAVWREASVSVDTDDEDLREPLVRAFRPRPVIVDDDGHRPQGTSGEVLVAPGTLEWFRAAAQVRATVETGLEARLVPGIREGGYDPAAQYRTFEDAIERLDDRAG